MTRQMRTTLEGEEKERRARIPDGKGGGLVRGFQNELRDLPLGAAEGGLHLPQA